MLCTGQEVPALALIFGVVAMRVASSVLCETEIRKLCWTSYLRYEGFGCATLCLVACISHCSVGYVESEAQKLAVGDFFKLDSAPRKMTNVENLSGIDAPELKKSASRSLLST